MRLLNTTKEAYKTDGDTLPVYISKNRKKEREMNFELFSGLYKEASESSDKEMFIAELGWQEWMNQYNANQIGIMLSDIYTLANSGIRENRERYGLTRAAFCRRHNIPRRTAESWEMEQNKIAPYLKELFDYSFLTDPKQEEENRMLKIKEELQEVLDFIEQDFGALLNDSEINDSQVSEFETNGKIKFECYHDKNKYAIVSKDEIELDGFTDHYQTGDFEVYYFGA